MLDRLPDNLLQSILEHTLPQPTSPRTVPARYRLLLNYCRISRSVARVSHALLFVHVDLTTSIACNEFCRAADGSARGVAFTRTRVLRFGPPGPHDQRWPIKGGDVEQVVRRTPGVKRFYADHVPISPLDLSVLVDLESLHLHRVEFFFPSVDWAHALSKEQGTTWHLPHLRSLSLSHIVYSESDNNSLSSLQRFLNPLALPHLRSFAFTWDRHTSDPGFWMLAPQLTRLWLRRITLTDRNGKSQIEYLPVDDLKNLSYRLEHLAIDVHKTVDLDGALGKIGTAHLVPLTSLPHAQQNSLDEVLPRTLRLESPYHTAAERLVLAQSLPAFERLDYLFVDDLSGLQGSVKAQHKSVRQAVVEECEARGVQVVEKRFVGGSSRECIEWDEARWREWCEEVDREMQVKITRMSLEENGGGEGEEEEDGEMLIGYAV